MAGCARSGVVDQVVVNHGTIPLDELYFALKPASRNRGAVDHAALIAGRPQTIESNPRRRLSAVPHRRRGRRAQHPCGDLRRAAADEGRLSAGRLEGACLRPEGAVLPRGRSEEPLRREAKRRIGKPVRNPALPPQRWRRQERCRRHWDPSSWEGATLGRKPLLSPETSLG